jgi:ornithine decarboxylase
MNKVLMDTILQNPNTQTPALVLDFDVIQQTYTRFLNAFPGGQIFYAMKANANQQVVQLVVDRQGGLEIASLAELERSLDAGALGEQIICSNPIKNPLFLQKMHQVGVYAMVVDSTYEVEKVAQYAPNSRIYVRLAVDNHGSVLPLAGKFGVSAEEALALFDQARDLGLQPIGLSFHVGSQCLSVKNWVNAIRACGEIWREAEARGHKFNFLDLGGGFPAGHYHDETIPTIEEIGALSMEAIAEFIPQVPNLMLVLEPGRGLVGESGRLLATVVGKAKRGTESWLYLDAGVFNGLMETYEGFPPVVSLLNEKADAKMESYTLAGPSCDSCDVIARNLPMPEINIGDKLVFYDTGAYTNEYAVAFNGFPIPSVIALNVEPEAKPV